MSVLRTLAPITLALAVAGCSEPVAPTGGMQPSTAPQLGAQPHLNAPTVLNTFLLPERDAASGQYYLAAGRIQLRISAAGNGAFPAGPCRMDEGLVPPPVPDFITLCAVIANPGGKRLAGGVFALANGGRTLVSIGNPGNYPTGPCRNYLVRGALVLTREASVAIASHPGDYAALFQFQEVDPRPAGEIRGIFGPPQGGPGDFGSIFGFQEVDPRDPPCTVNLTTSLHGQ